MSINWWPKYSNSSTSPSTGNHHVNWLKIRVKIVMVVTEDVLINDNARDRKEEKNWFCNTRVPNVGASDANAARSCLGTRRHPWVFLPRSNKARSVVISCRKKITVRIVFLVGSGIAKRNSLISTCWVYSQVLADTATRTQYNLKICRVWRETIKNLFVLLIRHSEITDY